jgi:hypothetical protein
MQHLIDYLLVVLLIVVPMRRILRRGGFSRSISLECFVPLVAFGVRAFMPWRGPGSLKTKFGKPDDGMTISGSSAGLTKKIGYDSDRKSSLIPFSDPVFFDFTRG